METINHYLGTALGWLMFFCYQILKNYGLAIILFTLFTKIILLPLSIWVQKNSVKIVKLQPEINHIKAAHFGDKDAIAEKQAELYKREKYNAFASIIPLAVQLVLLMGLVDVIYNPLTHIFHLSQDVCTAMVSLTGELTGIDTQISSIQMSVVDAVKDPAYLEAFQALGRQLSQADFDAVLSAISQSSMSLFGISLGAIPSATGGVTLLMPVVAAAAAWLLCVAQNRINPLQAEQGKLNQIGMTLLSVGISLFLGAFVPLGVGFYWIWSNLFTIVLQVVLNWMIDPKKYIDYEELEKSRAELAELEGLGKKKKLFFFDPNAKRERADYKRFFSVANKHLVFYSEGSGYYKYFEDIIEYLLKHSNVVIHYITGDPEDAIFKKEEPRIRTYYIGEKKLITLMMKMDADIVVMTMPDLETYHIKRSYLREDIEYIYTEHGISSNNLMLREGALAHFDTIFCVGPHQVEEYRQEEKVYGLKERTLVEVGYCLLDNMRRNYQNMPKVENDKKTILIGPSWQKDNILDTCIDALLKQVVGQGYRVIVRPHPQYVRLYEGRVNALIERWKDKLDADFQIETDFSSNVTVYTADLVVTDWSNIGYEFSFATNKPTLYINTPMKVMNPNYEKLGVTPFDIQVRSEIGAEIDLDRLDTFGDTVKYLIDNTPEYYDIIEQIRQRSFFNLGTANEAGGQYIINSLKEKQRTRKQEKVQ